MNEYRDTSTMTKALYWFTCDLRLADNNLFQSIQNEHKQVYACYVIEEYWFEPNQAGSRHLSIHRWQFLKQSLLQLAANLAQYDIELIVTHGARDKAIEELIYSLQITDLYTANQVGLYEIKSLQNIADDNPQLKIHTMWQHTLFNQQQISELDALSGSFSRFRKKVEKSPLLHSLSETILPSADKKMLKSVKAQLTETTQQVISGIDEIFRTDVTTNAFNGGYVNAVDHLETYLSSGAASDYKTTRNQLEGTQYSTQLSPWLANGSLSPKQVWHAVEKYELEREANESTYWIKFELLWREYFQWLSLNLGSRLFSFRGLAKQAPLTSFHPERFQKWCHGATPYPLVNALMKQLNATGFMSNRGRQIVASCFVNELQLDWRYGAAYFEQQLVDYDVASNWGNWQYIAGVGSDPRGGRWFNIDKQTELYDPNLDFCNKWRGFENTSPIDSVDAADWPVTT